jgi:single-stranded DNA-binding protein
MADTIFLMERVEKHKTLADILAEGHEMVGVQGKLGRDVMVRTTPTGKRIAEGALAVNFGKRTDPDRKVEWCAFNAWEEWADVLSEARKGESIFIYGTLKRRTWNANDGPHEVVAVSVWYASIGGKPQAGGGYSGGGSSREQGPPEDDVPF